MPEVAAEKTVGSEPFQKRQCTMPLDSVVLRFAKLTEHAFTPTRGSKLAAGYDLYRSIFIEIPTDSNNSRSPSLL